MCPGYRKFLFLWFASLVSATGSGMTSFALGIYIYQKTGLSHMAGLLLLLGFLPGLLLSPLAGVLADRFDRRLLMILGDGLSATGLLPILFAVSSAPQQLSIFLIGAGVAVSSAFSALVEPSFRATISDLLEKEDYSKAGGMMQLVSCARYLLSPVLSGIFLHLWNIHLILCLDILTIFLTIPITYLIRREMQANPVREVAGLTEDLRLGFSLIYDQKGVWLLVLFGILVSFCLGTVQTLMIPMILSFESESFLGFSTTFSACGMLVGGAFLSKVPIKKDFARILALSLLLMGIFMIGFAARENRLSVCSFGFCLFSALPFANTSIDYLVRIAIPRTHQGKVWGLIGIISQMGYIIAYSLIGGVADSLTRPLLIPGGPLSGSLGRLIGVSEGRGAALVIIFAGILLAITALLLSSKPEIKHLEEEHAMEIS